MQQETRVRGENAPRGEPSVAERAQGASAPGSVTSVSSEQLWRAAVVAARAAAVTAAELRRSIEAGRRDE